MDPLLATIIIFLSLLVFLLLGLPISFTLGGLAVIFTLLFWGPSGLLMITSHAYGEGTSFVLVAIPLFVFMAVILESSGIANKLYETMYKWFGAFPGGLASGTVVICAIFAAMAGISGVATVTMGLIALPSMLNKGYNPQMGMGAIACGGSLGVIIPPSVIAILYGSSTGASIGKLFMGGMVPGLLIAGIMIIYITIRCILNPNLGPPVPKSERSSWNEKLASLKNVLLPLLLVLLVLGSIYSGLSTPTEASAIGALGAILCAVINRNFSWSITKAALKRALNITCMAMWIVIAAKCFSTIYIASGASHFMLNLVANLDVSPMLIVGFMMFIIFILGMFIDPAGIIMICTPAFLPIVEMLGFDPVWFGILFILNSGMAYITPPFGFNLFYLKTVVPEGINMGDIYRSVWPFVICQAIVIILVMMFPQIGMWLPSLME